MPGGRIAESGPYHPLLHGPGALLAEPLALGVQVRSPGFTSSFAVEPRVRRLRVDEAFKRTKQGCGFRRSRLRNSDHQQDHGQAEQRQRGDHDGRDRVQVPAQRPPAPPDGDYGDDAESEPGPQAEDGREEQQQREDRRHLQNLSNEGTMRAAPASRTPTSEATSAVHASLDTGGLGGGGGSSGSGSSQWAVFFSSHWDAR